MAKGDELVKYITQRVVTYIDTPKEQRPSREELKQRPKEPWSVRWFGLLPMAIHIWVSQWRRRKNKSEPLSHTRQGRDEMPIQRSVSEASDLEEHT
jgi:hypothetical protein